MIEQSINGDPMSNSETSSRLSLMPVTSHLAFPNNYSITSKVKDSTASNKFTKKQSTDSGFESSDGSRERVSVCVNSINYSPDFLIDDENTRLSFGSINEGNESVMDIDASMKSFCRENTGE